MRNSSIERIRSLPIWQGEITARVLGSGRTNVNYLVEDAVGKYVVRLGENIVEHQVMRFNELAASHAAHAAGLSPEVIYAQSGLTVLEYLECNTFTSEDVRQHSNLEKIVPLIRSCHNRSEWPLCGIC